MPSINKIWLNVLSWAVSAFLVAISLPAEAANAGVDFYSQCPLLLAQADSFAQTCVANARPWGREFNGEPEVHVAYLGTPAPGSHFALGCTLNQKQKIAFLGVYYTIHPQNYQNFASSPLAYVDFDGGIGILVNGELINFLPVRPFITGKDGWNDPDYTLKNCDKLPPPATDYRNVYGQLLHFEMPVEKIFDIEREYYFITEWSNGNQIMIRSCIGPGGCLPDSEYISLYEPSDSQILLAAPTSHDFLEYFIENDGGLLIKNSVLKENCPIYYSAIAAKKPLPLDMENMIREVCLSPQYRSMHP